ncbi:MAG: xanthan lyase [Bacteroidales bacterium]|nr:xanthan lyase [Bacteroidales bacterium]
MNICKLALSLTLLLAPCLADAQNTSVTSRETKVLNAINSYRPGSTGYGSMKVDKVTVDRNRRTVTVKCNTATSYLPLTAETLASLKTDILKALRLPQTYKVRIIADGHTLDELALFADKKTVLTPSPLPFVVREDAPAAPKGLDGANIALWQSHGWYFEPKLNRWEWQRARIFQTVEDLYTQSYVMPYLMPMLENAGAYVMSPRERDTNRTEIIIDADNAATPGFIEFSRDAKWDDASTPGFAWDGASLVNSQNPFRQGKARRHTTTTDRKDESYALWTADIPADGNYAVYVSYVSEPNSAPDAHYTVNTANGLRHFTINQRMGGGTWIYLGHFPLKAGNNVPVVQLSDLSATPGTVVTADAVKIGGGMGNVARIVKEPLDSIDYQYTLSGYPRWVEGARYWLQWAGAPDSVYTPSDNVNDYNDDYRSRGLWVNWLAGGSPQMPGREGLGVPVDLSFAFHSDAGTFRNDSIVGTLGIYSTVGDTLGNGSSRMMSRDLTDLIMTDIVNDVCAGFEPRWTRRGMWDKSYFEARVPEVPAMLLELLSHQNFADMKYGLDPNFRFTVSRAVYKGMLKFLAHRDGREYVVQPLPVHNFAIAADKAARTYRLTWDATPDSLESTAMPTYYIIEHRRADDLGFTKLAEVTEPEYTVTVSDTDIHSYRIIAANEGGVSFPSEVLALCDLANGSEPVMVVNGFTRVSAPDWFEAGDIAGFYDVRDHGVPYVSEIAFIGSQFEYRRDIPWMDDDAAGFGASRSNYEDKVIAGNTFDYVYTHGRAIVDAGHSFISSSVGAYAASAVEGQPRIVDLILGKQKEIKQGRGVYGTRYKTFPGELQRKLTAATAAGTSVFVTGSYVATDLWDNPHSSAAVAEADQKFATEVLGYHWRVGQASTEGMAYEVPCRFKQFTGGRFDFSHELNADIYAVESPDSFYASDKTKGCTIMRYDENNLVAGTASDMGGYRTVILGFPFETIEGTSSRANLMRQILDFFSK